MHLLIYKIDSCESEGPVCILEDGEHIIGRGETLGCNDKRTSRTHACIKVQNENATITSTHLNPCFFQSANSNTIVILPKDVPKEIKEGDKFGIFPDSFWFRIQFQKQDHLKISNGLNINENNHTNAEEICSDNHNITNIVNEQTEINDVQAANLITEPITGPNSEQSETLASEDKNCSNLNANNNTNTEKISSGHHNIINNVKEEININDTQTVNVISKASTHLNSEESKVLTPEDTKLESTLDTSTCSNDPNFNSSILPNEIQEVISENLSSISNDETVGSSNENKKVEDDQLTANDVETGDCDKTDLNNIDDVQPSSSGTNATVGNSQETKPQRDKCWYGNNCYRKNLNHRKEYSHPGDSDYESDPNDTRPLCRYGKNCYRKNKDHQKKYKHSGVDLKQPRHGNKKRNCTKKLKKDMEDDISEDEYDLDDPFLNEDSEDAYNEESWSESDSTDDWTDSNNEADNENTKTLLKEAKRFTKRKK